VVRHREGAAAPAHLGPLGGRQGRELAQGLRQLAALSAAERAEMGRRGRAFAMAHHAFPVLGERFIQALQ